MTDKHCPICGKVYKRQSEYTDLNFEGFRYPICNECRQATLKLNSSIQSKKESGIEYLKNQLESGKADHNGIPLIKSFLGQNITEEERSNMDKTIANAQIKKNSTTFELYYVFGVIFAVLTVIFGIASVNNSYNVANIQGSLYTVASAIISALCFATGSIINAIKRK